MGISFLAACHISLFWLSHRLFALWWINFSLSLSAVVGGWDVVAERTATRSATTLVRAEAACGCMDWAVMATSRRWSTAATAAGARVPTTAATRTTSPSPAPTPPRLVRTADAKTQFYCVEDSWILCKTCDKCFPSYDTIRDAILTCARKPT